VEFLGVYWVRNRAAKCSEVMLTFSLFIERIGEHSRCGHLLYHGSDGQHRESEFHECVPRGRGQLTLRY